MIDETENENAQSKGKTETDGSFGDGKAGAASGVGFRLTINKDKQVRAERQVLNAAEATAALVEFCSDILVASAHAVVTFLEKAKMTVSNANSFAINHWVVDFQKKLPSYDAIRERNRGADSQGLKQKKPKNNKTFNKGQPGPSGAQ